jgi:hypothetical protein
MNIGATKPVMKDTMPMMKGMPDGAEIRTSGGFRVYKWSIYDTIWYVQELESEERDSGDVWSRLNF